MVFPKQSSEMHSLMSGLDRVVLVSKRAEGDYKSTPDSCGRSYNPPCFLILPRCRHLMARCRCRQLKHAMRCDTGRVS